MRLRKSVLVFALLAALAWWGWNWLQTHVEVVTLHVRAGAGGYDHYPRLFIVDDGNWAWVRVVRRAGRDVADTAVPWTGGPRHDRVDRLFQEKYGAFDVASGFFWRRDAVPVRLERSDSY